MTEAKYKIFADCKCRVGENPIWVPEEERFYWLDLFCGDIYRKSCSADSSKFERFELNIGKIGGMARTSNGQFLLFADKCKVWKWSPNASPIFYTELKSGEGSRFNDIIADPNGGVFCGVAPSENESGSLWHMLPDRSFECIEKHTKGMPNGMGFSPDSAYFYFTVSDERIIYRYDFNMKYGNLYARRPFIKFPECEGVPDGLTVDSFGNIWSAQWKGNRLVEFSPSGEMISEYRFPCDKISSIAFGGRDFEKIIATTANRPWNDKSFADCDAGKVLELEGLSTGKDEFTVIV